MRSDSDTGLTRSWILLCRPRFVEIPRSGRDARHLEACFLAAEEGKEAVDFFHKSDSCTPHTTLLFFVAPSLGLSLSLSLSLSLLSPNIRRKEKEGGKANFRGYERTSRSASACTLSSGSHPFDLDFRRSCEKEGLQLETYNSELLLEVP